MSKTTVKGVSPDAPISVNEQGGKQSLSPYRVDLMPPVALLKVAEVLAIGAKRYAPNNWRKIPVEDHLNHMLVHAFAMLAGDESDDHVGHMACRAMMAAEIALVAKADKEKAALAALEASPQAVAESTNEVRKRRGRKPVRGRGRPRKAAK